MKKLFSALVILSIIATLFCATALADLVPQQVVGTWYMLSRHKDVNLVESGIEVVVEFNRDRTATVTVDGVTVDYNWQLYDDAVVLRKPNRTGSEGFYRLTEDGTLLASSFLIVNDEQWHKTLLVRDLAEPEKVLKIAPAEGETAFLGTYQWVGSETDLPEETADIDFTQFYMTIDVAQATLQFEGETTAIYVSDIADAKLLLYSVSIDNRKNSLVFELELDENGMLLANDGEMVHYFAPVDVETVPVLEVAE